MIARQEQKELNLIGNFFRLFYKFFDIYLIMMEAVKIVRCVGTFFSSEVSLGKTFVDQLEEIRGFGGDPTIDGYSRSLHLTGRQTRMVVLLKEDS